MTINPHYADDPGNLDKPKPETPQQPQQPGDFPKSNPQKDNPYADKDAEKADKDKPEKNPEKTQTEDQDLFERDDEDIT